MPKYSYIAKSIKGDSKTGEIEAKDEHQLAEILHQEGYILISSRSEKKSPKINLRFSLPFLDKISLKEKLFFTRNLKVMISAGISLPRCLRTLSEITKNKKFRKALLEITDSVNKGRSFSDSLENYPDIFPELFCSLIRAGEESGTLEDSLKNLSQQMERQHELNSKIMGALMYPIVIVSAMIGIGVLMLVMVIPKLSQTFQDMGVELPFTTKMVMFLGNFMAQRWYFLILIIAALVIVSKIIMSANAGKRARDKILLKLPVISSLVQKINSAYMTRTISSLISSGVPIVNSLEITSTVLNNVYFREALIQSAEKVKKGGKLSEALKAYGSLYPLVVIQMIEVGEETGETSDILQKLADFFEEEVTTTTRSLSSIIEPILMLLIGSAIGFFAISIIQPMYSVMETL